MRRSIAVNLACAGGLVGGALLAPMTLSSEAATSSGAVRVAFGQLTFVAAAGVRNSVTVSGGPTRSSGTSDFVVRDHAPLTAGQGCQQIDPMTVECDPTGVTTVSLDGGDRSDSLSSLPYVYALIYGGPGDDRLSAYGRSAGLTGGLGNDALFGSPEADSLSGDEGNDYLSANAGRDRVEGGLGDDELFGGAGPDLERGREGDDTVVGDKGPDRLRGDSCNDAVGGAAGNDREVGGPGLDSISGGGGDDSM